MKKSLHRPRIYKAHQFTLQLIYSEPVQLKFPLKLPLGFWGYQKAYARKRNDNRSK